VTIHIIKKEKQMTVQNARYSSCGRGFQSRTESGDPAITARMFYSFFVGTI